MPKSYSSHELIQIAASHGWQLDRVRGSHHVFRHPTRPGLVVIPHPRKDISAGTARSILRHIGAL
ncbi:MAG: type II toxin-antitoxin system HicA family toxin [Deltaproteobacteria bacterium]|nr:type II toxin-antitoxin system HicA family toxin [Deltaproteobacteria bacterium]